MRVDSIIISDFYNNVDEVRAFALSQEFSVTGNFPNLRTKSFLDDGIKQVIQKIIEPLSGKITFWGNDYTASFQYTTAQNRSWMHTDETDWAGVCYLTPDAPISGGTGLFRRKDKSQEKSVFSADYYDMTQWELVDRIGNLYNRLILYRGDLYHTSLDYFGRDIDTGRLFQTFFFNTEH
jgi:hypothetical protein